MAVSTIAGSKKFSPATLIAYILGIVGVGLVVFFGGEVIKNIGNLRGKAGISIETPYTEAQILINDKEMGNTPFESDQIKPGTNKITIKNSDRQYQTSINFLPVDNKLIHVVGIVRDLGVSDIFSSGQNLWFEKDKSGTMLRVVSEPAEAKVFIDGVEMGISPYVSNSISEGEYELRVELPGFETQSSRINIQKDYSLNANVQLFPIPVPTNVKEFEDSLSLYNLAIENPLATSDTESWAKAIVYWNKTRGINIEGTGENKSRIFDYFVDYKGNIYNANGEMISTPEDLQALEGAERAGYLGRISDGEGVTQEAKEALETLSGIAVGSKTATILPTGIGWLRVRETPQGTEISKVDVGETYSVLDEKDGWVKIKVSEEVEGWVSGDYVELSE